MIVQWIGSPSLQCALSHTLTLSTMKMSTYTPPAHHDQQRAVTMSFPEGHHAHHLNRRLLQWQ